MENFNSFFVSFYIRKNRNKLKNYSVFCCIKLVKRTTEICISGSIQKTEWDIGKARPKLETDYLIKLSIYLDTIKAELFNIYLDLKLTGEECTAQRIKTVFLNKDLRQFTFLQLIDKAIEKYQHELAKGSLKNYHATRSYVEKFCKSKYKSGDVSLKFINYSFIDDFKIFILSNPLKVNGRCINNGCMKHMERIKKIVTWAYAMRYIDRNVFASFKIRKTRYESKWLNLEQLTKIQNRKLHLPMLSLVRDLFVFCCYTGMAPIDMQQLKPHQIYCGTDQMTWMTNTRTKSKISANVPLLSQAIEIVKKHELRKGDLFRTTVFPFVTNKNLNDNLKVISEICELDLSLNFYIARHTFATTVTLLHGVPITSIKEMMGHDRIETAMRYAKKNNSVIAADMKLVQERMNSLCG